MGRRHSSGSHASHGSHGGHHSGHGHHGGHVHHGGSHGHRQPSPSRMFYPGFPQEASYVGRVSDIGSRRTSEAALSEASTSAAVGLVGMPGYAMHPQAAHDMHYRHFQTHQQQQQQQRVGQQHPFQQPQNPSQHATSTTRAPGGPPGVPESPVKPLPVRSAVHVVSSTGNADANANANANANADGKGNAATANGASASATTAGVTAGDAGGDVVSSRKQQPSSQGSSIPSGPGVTLVANSTPSRAAMDAAVTDAKAGKALADALAGVRAVTGADFGPEVVEGRRTSSAFERTRSAQDALQATHGSGGRPSVGASQQPAFQARQQPYQPPQAPQSQHYTTAIGPNGFPVMVPIPATGRPSWEHRVAVSSDAGGHGGASRRSSAMTMGTPPRGGAASGRNSVAGVSGPIEPVSTGGDGGTETAGVPADPFEGLRVTPDLLCPVDEPPRYDFILSLRADLGRLRNHPLLESFPVGELLERLESAQSHFHGSNMSGTPFRGPLDAVLAHLGYLLNAPSVRALLQPVEARLKAMEERVNALRGAQEAARSREDVAAEKDAVMGEIDALRKLIAEHKTTKSIIESARDGKAGSMPAGPGGGPGGGGPVTLAQLEETSIERLEAVSGNFALVGADARDDLEDLEARAHVWTLEDEEARALHTARETELMAARRERGEEQVAIIEEVQRLLRRYGELQAANEADTAEMSRAGALEKRRREARQASERDVSRRVELLSNTARNADIAVRIASELRDTVRFWLRGVADLVDRKAAELAEAERFVTLRAAQAYTDFYLVTRRLIFIEAERLAKARRDLDHARAEKSAAMAMLNPAGVAHWNQRIASLTQEAQAAQQRLSGLESALGEERDNFSGIEESLGRLALGGLGEDPEDRWREDEKELRDGLAEVERKRVETWQTAVLGLLRAGKEADGQIRSALGNVMITDASFATDASNSRAGDEFSGFGQSIDDAGHNNTTTRYSESPASMLGGQDDDDDDDNGNGTGNRLRRHSRNYQGHGDDGATDDVDGGDDSEQ